MTDPFEPPADASHVTTADGEAFIWQPLPGIVLQKASGVLSSPLIETFLGFYAPILKPGARIQVFDDFAMLTHYTKEARDLVTAFTVERRSALEAIHVLIASKYMALGLTAFGYGVGEDLVFTYSDRKSFLRSLAKATGESSAHR